MKRLPTSRVNSCGLEAIDMTSEDGAVLAKKLKADSTDKIAKDHVRKCVCGEVSIVYAYTEVKVTRYCENCGLFESKITTTGL